MQFMFPAKKKEVKMNKYKYYKKDEDKWINAEIETWQWQVVYEDGIIFKQFDDNGIFHQFAEIDQTKVTMFKMVSPEYSHSYELLMSDPSMKLIHFYRNTVLNAGTEEETHIRLYCFGYEKKIGSNTQKIIMAITPTNELIVTEDSNLITV